MRTKLLSFSMKSAPNNPTILVNIHGGMVQDVYGKNGPVDVMILDWDKEGVTDDEMKADDAIFKHRSTYGRIYSEPVRPWREMEKHTEMVAAVEHADGIINATYVSEWDNGTTVRSPCKYDTTNKRCFDIQQSDTDVGNANFVREYVTLPDGTELGEDDDVTFDY